MIFPFSDSTESDRLLDKSVGILIVDAFHFAFLQKFQLILYQSKDFIASRLRLQALCM